MNDLTLYATLTARHLRDHLWEKTPSVPIMVPASTCYDVTRKRLRSYPIPKHCRPLAADSGGFVFASKHGDYPFTTREYIEWLTQLQPDWAAIMDSPCEEDLAQNDYEIEKRQLLTIGRAARLAQHKGSWQWMPVLQGRTVEQYLDHARAYRSIGLIRPYMGIGSLCRRTLIGDIQAIVAALAKELPQSRFHLFGVKLGIFKDKDALHPQVASADTAAWNGRFGTGIDVFNAVMAQRGWTQARTEIQWALPQYIAKVTRAVRAPKQLRIDL